MYCYFKKIMIVEYKREFLLIKKEVKCGNEIYIIIVEINLTNTNEWRLRK